MTPYEALELFRAQVERRTGLKSLLLPCAVKEAGLVVTIAVRKTPVNADTQRTRAVASCCDLRLVVAAEGKVESLTGLKMAVDGCWALAKYFSKPGLHLEDEEGYAVPGTRVMETINPEDGILEDPESGKISWVRDEHFITITLPPE